jgi:hypothetical protein
MQSDKKTASRFRFIHPDHASLPVHVRIFWNTVAMGMLILPFVMPATLAIGVVLGLSALQDNFPALGTGIALLAITAVKATTVSVACMCSAVAFSWRARLSEIARDELYQTIQNDVLPRRSRD